MPVIVVDDAIAHATQAFAGFGEVLPLPSHKIGPQVLARLGAEVLLVRSVTRVDDAMLDAAPTLRFVGTATAGIDHLDVPALERSGVSWASAAGCNAQAVAEWVVAALTMTAGKLAIEPSSVAIGVVGFGNVGSRLTRLLRRLGHEVLVCDPPLQRRGGVDEPFVSFEELWRKCGVVSFHVPLITEGPDATLAYVDRHTPFAGAPKLLINTSRGAVLPDRALDRPDVAGAILDVWEGEPELPWARFDDPRLSLASPHVAGYSLEAKLAGTQMMHDALCGFFGQAPSWTAAELLEPIQLTGPLEGLSSPARVLARVVDLAGDDARVRALAELPLAARAGAFERLRREYRLRREFCSWRVEADHELATWLRSAGFGG